MLRTIFLVVVAFIAGSFILSFLFGLFGIAIGLIGFAVKLLVLAAIAYLAVRVISPSTAALLRDRVERRTLNRF